MAYLDEVNKQNPHVVLILQLEGSGLITKSEARKNLRRVLSEDFIWDEPVTVYPPCQPQPFMPWTSTRVPPATWNTNTSEQGVGPL